MAIIPLKLYSTPENRFTSVQALPGTNTPSGFIESSIAEAVAAALQKLQYYKDYITDPPGTANSTTLSSARNEFERLGGEQALQSLRSGQIDFNVLGKATGIDPSTLQQISQGQQVASQFSNWNGAIVETSKIPQLEAEGATVVNGNIVGPAVAGLNPTEINGQTDSIYPSGGTGTPPQLTQDVFNQTMSSMQNKGLTINPNANLDDPKTLAEFLRVAEGEVEPYYKSQLKVARDQFLRQQGYTTDDILRNEQELEKKYGAQVRDLAASAAESGFAQSGRRVEGERNLASDTQNIIDENRRKLGFEAYGQAGQYAQTYGGLLGEKAPQGPQLANAPRVLAGETSFERPGGTSAFYQLSNDVYDNLVGSQEKERVTGIRDLAQQQEELYRTNQTRII